MNTSVFFDCLFFNAHRNCILVMTLEGVVLQVNEAFCDAFGYSTEEITGKKFNILFTEKDLSAGKPEAELQKVKATGSAEDNNFMVNKDGTLTWVSGESIYVKTAENENDYIIKLFQNIQTQKQLEKFLVESSEFFETLVESLKDMAVVILDSMMRVLKVNTTFIKMFELEAAPEEGNRLTDIDHAFWANDEIKKEIRNIIVTNKSVKEKKFRLNTKSGNEKSITLSAKIMYVEPTLERKIFVMMKELSA
jgi:PAS domain S-box-containing protein